MAFERLVAQLLLRSFLENFASWQRSVRWAQRSAPADGRRNRRSRKRYNEWRRKQLGLEGLDKATADVARVAMAFERLVAQLLLRSFRENFASWQRSVRQGQRSAAWMLEPREARRALAKGELQLQ
jgi:hypothetical protein